jgi:hypothetical protein
MTMGKTAKRNHFRFVCLVRLAGDKLSENKGFNGLSQIQK